MYIRYSCSIKALPATATSLLRQNSSLKFKVKIISTESLMGKKKIVMEGSVFYTRKHPDFARVSSLVY